MSSAPHTSNFDLLRGNHWIGRLPEHALRELAQHCRRRHMARDEMVVKKGEKPEGLVLVIRGCIQSSTISEDGREIVFAAAKDGNLWGVVALLDGQGAVHDTYASCTSELLIVPAQPVHDLLKREPALYTDFVQMLCYRLRKAYSSVNEYGLASLRQRLARQLCTLALSAEDSTEYERIKLTQEQLAHLVGATRPRVNRELQTLQADGLIHMQYGSITVLDYKRLHDLCSSEMLFNL